MGHAHHFLSRLDRVSRTTRSSSRLYNNAPLVKHVLARAGLPPGPSASPSRSTTGARALPHRHARGRFVTCLGRGCATSTRSCGGGSSTVLAERHEALKACMRPSSACRRTRAIGRLDRLLGAGEGLSREAFLDLATLQPCSSPTTWVPLPRARLDLQARHDLPEPPERPKPRDRDALRKLWEHLWAVKHLCALIGVGDPRSTTPTARATSWRASPPPSRASPGSTARCASRGGRVGHGALRRRLPARVRPRLRALALSSSSRTSRPASSRPSRRAPGRQGGARRAARRPPSARRGEAGLCHDRERATHAERVLRAFERPTTSTCGRRWPGARRVLDARRGRIARLGWRRVGTMPVDVAMPLAVDSATRGSPAARGGRALHIARRWRATARGLLLPSALDARARRPWDPDCTMSYLEAMAGYYALNPGGRREGPRAQRAPATAARG